MAGNKACVLIDTNFPMLALKTKKATDLDMNC